MRRAVPRVDRRARGRARGRARARAAARRSSGASCACASTSGGGAPCRRRARPCRRAPARAAARRRQARTNAGQREDDERGPPRERGDVAGDREADAGADVLAGEDDAVDPAALPAAEPVADERGDHRAGRGRDARRGRAASSSSSVKFEAVALQSIAAPQVTIVTPSTRVRVTRSASTPNGSDANAPTSELTATSRPMSVFVMWRPVPELARRRADRRGVGAAQPEDRARGR